MKLCQGVTEILVVTLLDTFLCHSVSLEDIPLLLNKIVSGSVTEKLVLTLVDTFLCHRVSVEDSPPLLNKIVPGSINEILVQAWSH